MKTKIIIFGLLFFLWLYCNVTAQDLDIFPQSENLKIINSIAFSPNGKHLIISSHDSRIIIWDVATGKEIRTLQEHGKIAFSLAYSPNGKIIVSGSYGGTIMMWDEITGRSIRTIKGHEDHINSITFSQDGNTFLTVSYDNTIKLWNANTGGEMWSFPGQAAMLNPNGKTLISAFGYIIELYDTTSGLLINTFLGHSEIVNSIAFSPDCRQISSITLKNIKIWDTLTGSEIKTLPVGGSKISYSPDGQLILVANENNYSLWEISTGRKIREYEGFFFEFDNGDIIQNFVFSPNGETIAFEASFGVIELYDITTETKLKSFSNYGIELR